MTSPRGLVYITFIDFLGKFGLTASRQQLGLLDPIIARHPALEAFQVGIDPRDLRRRPRRDLVEVVKAQSVAELFELGPDALDLLEVVGTALASADLDGDQDLDVLAASRYDDTVAWYENDGASPPSFTRHVITDQADGAYSVAVGDGEEVGTAVLAKMRKHQEAVLIDFVRILRAETGFGRKCELCDAIVKFFVGLPRLHCVLRSGRDLFRDACTDVLTLIIRRLTFITGFVLP